MDDATGGDRDERLLRRLAAAAREVDPVPDHVRDLGRAAFMLRGIDEELADLVSTSGALAGVRGAGEEDLRLLAFASGDVVVETQVVVVGATRTLTGQVVLAPGSGGVVRVRHTLQAAVDAPLSPLGEFRVDQVQPGLVRLVVDAPPTRPVSTAWFRI